MSCIDEWLTILLVACDSECITVAAVHHESDVVAAYDLSLDVKFFCVFLGKSLNVLVSGIEISVPKASRIKS